MRSLRVILLAVFISLLFIGCYHGKHRPIDVYLTVESEHGSPTPPVGENYLNYGMTITASVDSLVAGATEGTRYVCTGWTGTGSAPPSGSTNSVTFTITTNAKIIWNWQTNYYLAVVSPYGAPVGAGWYNEGATAHWSVTSPYAGGTGIEYVTSPTSGDVVMSSPETVTVTWTTQYYLTTTVSPESGGTITRLPSAAWYDSDAGVQLTAAPNAGYEFTEWSGNLGGTSNPETLTMNAPKSVTANFSQIPPPVANFTASPTTAFESPLTVQFTDTSTGIITSWQWDFDNNGTVDSTQQNPSYVYTNPGAYTVKLTVTGPGGSDEEVKVNYIAVGVWAKSYGGTGQDHAYSIQQTIDGGYIVAGWTMSFGAGFYDLWVLKLNSNGSVAWQKRYGGADYDDAYSIQQTSDGGYIVAGRTWSFSASSGDFWILKLNADGSVAWQKRYGGADYDGASSIQQISDGGYIVAGGTESFGAGEMTSDFLVLKLNSNGSVAWQKRYGGTSYDWANSIQQTIDGRYIMAGETASFGLADLWVLKLASDGTIPFNPASGAQMTDTNAVPVDTNCTVLDTTATATNTSATVTDTNCTVTDTDATIEQQAP